MSPMSPLSTPSSPGPSPVPEASLSPEASPRASAPGLLLAVVAVALLLGACGEDDGPPVATLAASPEVVELPHGTFEEIELAWSAEEALGATAGEPLVFVHLLDGEDRLQRTFDHRFPGPWTPGAEVRYPVRLYQSILAPPLPPGEYTLSAGLYDRSGQRWALDTGGERLGRGEYRVATVTVASNELEAPELVFSDAWAPTMAGTDRQVLAERWLEGEGTIRVEHGGAEGRLWLELLIPLATEESPRVWAEGAEPGIPRVLVETDCADLQADLSGEGVHELEVAVGRGTASETGEAPPADTCTVRLIPNSTLAVGGIERRSVVLRNVAWSAGG